MSAVKPFSEEEIEYILSNFVYEPSTGQLLNLREKNGGGGKKSLMQPLGSIDGKGYASVSIRSNGKYRSARAHRFAWLLWTGKCPGAMQIDHIDHNRSNNRFGNLRLVTHLQNKKNESLRKDSSSGATGVSKCKNKWIAYYYDGGKRVDLGVFDSKEAAIKARKSANAAAGFHENHGQQPLIGRQHV